MALAPLAPLASPAPTPTTPFLLRARATETPSASTTSSSAFTTSVLPFGFFHDPGTTLSAAVYTAADDANDAAFPTILLSCADASCPGPRTATVTGDAAHVTFNQLPYQAYVCDIPAGTTSVPDDASMACTVTFQGATATSTLRASDLLQNHWGTVQRSITVTAESAANALPSASANATATGSSSSASSTGSSESSGRMSTTASSAPASASGSASASASASAAGSASARVIMGTGLLGMIAAVVGAVVA